ncbi:sensor histidine kinase [Vallitalea okinawensis]|uniref:sensor histidine kinase n=1 Tax=Vallitalea okinawensis TaxID=2078660 RepID=UPI000CFB17A4|nr:sensor histidine kinase [Vallitalea okinawensis]
MTLTIKHKLLLSLISISIIPIIIVGLIFNIQSRKDIMSKISLFASKTVIETANHLANHFENIEATLDGVMVLDEVQNNLYQYETYGELERITISTAIEDIIFNNYVMGNYMNYFEILTDDNVYFFNYGYKILDKSHYPYVRQKAYEYGGKSYFDANSEQDAIIITRAINKGFTLQPMGYMIMSIQEEFFSEVYEGLINIDQGIKAMILDGEGWIISSNQYDLRGQIDSQSMILHNMKTEEDAYFSIELEDEWYVATYAPIDKTDYYLVCLIPYSYLNEETYQLDRLFIIVVISCIAIAFVLALILTKAIFRPLNQLVDVMKHAEQGDLSIQLDYHKKDEIGYLTENFNRMLKRIQHLIIQLEEEEKEKREAELNMLQAQINPHFLFNVLNSLKFTAMMSQSYSVSDGIDALASLLRDTINDKNEFITLRKEIENIQHYIVIQRIRYGESFQLHHELTEEILSCCIPKLLLQPIVENSIIHGFEDIDYTGIITINGRLEDGTIILDILDNGRGLSKASLKKIKSVHYKSKNQLSSIGLHNVEQRIKLHYGQQYGINIDSNKNGTKVSIKIPYHV